MGTELAKVNLPQEVKTYSNFARAKSSADNFDFLNALNDINAQKNAREKVTENTAQIKPKNIDKDDQANSASLEENEISDDDESQSSANSGATIPYLLANLILTNGQNDVSSNNKLVLNTGSLSELNNAINALKLGQTLAQGTNLEQEGTAQTAVANLEPSTIGNQAQAQSDIDGTGNLAQLLTKLGADKGPNDAEIKTMTSDIAKSNGTVLQPKTAQNNNEGHEILIDANSQNDAQNGNQANAQSGNSNGQNLGQNGANSNANSNIIANVAKAKNGELQADVKLEAVKASGEILENLNNSFDQLQTNAASDAAPIGTQTTESARVNMQALAAMIARKHLNGEKSIFVRLDPAELGGVQVELKFGANKKLSAIINVEKAEALKELSNYSANLLQSLRDTGLDVADNAIEFQLDFSPNEQNQSQSWAAQSQNKNSKSANENDSQSESVAIVSDKPANQNIITPHLEIWKRAKISIEA